MHTRPGLLFILVAPAGAGKNALMNIVLQNTADLRQLPTATTRAMRAGEQQGREHMFVSHAQFLQMIDDDALLEWQEVHGRLYGVPRETVETALANEDDLIADIEFKGAAILRDAYPDNTVAIFIQPPSISTLIERMRSRGETEAAIGRRMLRVPEEIAYVTQCDYIIHNTDIAPAAERLRSIILAEKSRRDLNKLRANDGTKLVSFSYTSAIAVLHESAVLCHQADNHLPTVALLPQETPVEAALRALHETLGITPDMANLTSHNQTDPDFVPPIYVDCNCPGSDEQVLMYYLYRLNERVSVSGNWHWQPLDSVSLPQPVREALENALEVQQEK
jgi:guanylate kinase